MFIATLIAAKLSPDHVGQADRGIAFACDGASDTPLWTEPGVACDIGFNGDPFVVRSLLEGGIAGRPWPGVDVVVQPEADRRKKLLVADMDSTMISCECIDELADYAGIKAEIAAVTEAAMRGELDFEAALDARVELLKGLAADSIARCLAERVRIMPGARALVRTMNAHGARTVLVSGGFMAFAQPVGKEIGFHRVIANRLDIAGDALAGTVARPIVGAAAKRETLEAERALHGLGREETLAVGDGANDIPMIEAAGLGIAYHAKPKTAAAAGARIDHGDLTALLYAQGYPRSAWVTD